MLDLSLRSESSDSPYMVIIHDNSGKVIVA